MYTTKNMIALFRQAGARKARFDVDNKRELHKFDIPCPEVLIANNSGLFFALEARRQDGLLQHPRLVCFVPDFWMDKIHPDYFHHDWGQPLLGFPLFVQRLFHEIYPSHRVEDYV